MTSRPSAQYALLYSLCDTLTECERASHSVKPESPLIEHAKTIRILTEPLAIASLDQEMVNLPSVIREVFMSTSLPLVDHLRTLTSEPCILAPEEWTTLILATTPSMIQALLHRGLSPTRSLVPLLRAACTRKPGIEGLLFKEIGPRQSLSSTEYEGVLDARHFHSTSGEIQKTAAFLRLQVEFHPEAIARIAGQGLHERKGQFRAASAILAGIPPSAIAKHAMNPGQLGHYFLNTLSSHHALLAFHRACGPLEDFLKGHGDWVRWIEKLGSDMRAENARTNQS